MQTVSTIMVHTVVSVLRATSSSEAQIWTAIQSRSQKMGIGLEMCIISIIPVSVSTVYMSTKTVYINCT